MKIRDKQNFYYGIFGIVMSFLWAILLGWIVSGIWILPVIIFMLFRFGVGVWFLRQGLM